MLQEIQLASSFPRCSRCLRQTAGLRIAAVVLPQEGAGVWPGAGRDVGAPRRLQRLRKQALVVQRGGAGLRQLPHLRQAGPGGGQVGACGVGACERGAWTSAAPASRQALWEEKGAPAPTPRSPFLVVNAQAGTRGSSRAACCQPCSRSRRSPSACTLPRGEARRWVA